MSSRARELLLLAAIVIAGLVPRLRDLEAQRPSPDEGSYMSSARLDDVGGEGGIGRWLAEDARWAREMARDYTRAEQKTSYPHSYLEQWIMRWFRRFGASYLASVRLGSALLGALLPIALFGAARRMRLASGAGLFAAAIGAFAPVFVWYSRAGWGQMGCTFFYVVYLGLAYRLLDPEAAHGRRELLGLGIGLAATSFLAYGWHEMIVVHVGWMGLAACLAALWWAPKGVRPRGFAARLVKSPRTWTYVASSVPAVLLLLGLAFLNPWAGDIWLNPDRDPMDRWERYRLASGYLFGLTRIQEQITWPVLALALVGLAAAFLRRKFLCAYLLLSIAGGVLPFFLLYNLPHLVRVYLPVLAIVALLAGEGFATLAGLARGAAARAAVAALALGLSAYLAAASWQTLFGAHDAPLALRRFDLKELEVDLRRSMRPIFEVLDPELEHGEVVGVFVAFEARFSLLDHGIRARMLPTGEGGALAESRERWPRFVVAVERDFAGMLNANYGADAPYALVVRETAERIGLYRRR